MTQLPPRRAEVSGHFVQFFSRNPNLATVRWHSRFKEEYRTKAQARAAKVEWEEQGKILSIEIETHRAQHQSLKSDRPVSVFQRELRL